MTLSLADRFDPKQRMTGLHHGNLAQCRMNAIWRIYARMPLPTLRSIWVRSQERLLGVNLSIVRGAGEYYGINWLVRTLESSRALKDSGYSLTQLIGMSAMAMILFASSCLLLVQTNKMNVVAQSMENPCFAQAS